MSSLTLEQAERERQWAAKHARHISTDDLRVVRARLADYLQMQPPEPAVSIIQIRGDVAHAEIVRREHRLDILGGLKRIGSNASRLFSQQYVTIPGWPSKLNE